MSRCFVSRGRRDTFRDIQTCFVTCRKSFLCGRGNTFASFGMFSEDALQLVFVAGAALWT